MLNVGDVGDDGCGTDDSGEGGGGGGGVVGGDVD